MRPNRDGDEQLREVNSLANTVLAAAAKILNSQGNIELVSMLHVTNELIGAAFAVLPNHLLVKNLKTFGTEGDEIKPYAAEIVAVAKTIADVTFKLCRSDTPMRPSTRGRSVV